uniref:Uncharacterized protein n=1 Tax=Zea mays TaxID=4577 RepID=B6T718_MAIZE|nr:hypothetical protein [Zea mays]
MASAEGERWVGLATDFSQGSREALQWAATNLLRAGDHLLLRYSDVYACEAFLSTFQCFSGLKFSFNSCELASRFGFVNPVCV